MPNNHITSCPSSVVGLHFLVQHFLETSADYRPDKEALVDHASRFTYLDIELKANKIANWLLESGMCKGERVALLIRNSLEYVCSYYGVLKAGGIVVPLNTGLDVEELAKMIADCSPLALITENLFLKALLGFIEKRPLALQFIVNVQNGEVPADLPGPKYMLLSQIYSKGSHERPCTSQTDYELASIIYTSGSTGKPKGVMLTHGNIVSNTRSIVSYLKLTSLDRCMSILPFYYVYGKSLLNTHFMVGGTVVIDNRFTFPNSVLGKMQKEEVTGFAGVPSTFSILLNKSSLAKMEFPHLRYITQAGGHMPSTVKKKLLEVLSGKPFFIMYGATEASARLAYLNPEKLSNHLHSIGRAIPNVELRIVKENGLPAKFGEEGEIIARGSNIMKGYWNDPVETAKVLIDGWYYTGDLGYRDRDNLFFITGRKREMIKVGLYKVSAIEVEDVIHGHPDIHEAAIVGMPDPNLGESLKAFIVLKNSRQLDEQSILDFCKERLPDYKIPRKIILADNLPKNEAGKVQKRKLTEDFF